ncbi:MAG: isocitrate/isopropylmalate dehydrogenase family protein [Euryarchaeota archaeon]|nr:isocitrate/isopropylmalate dehydrogenase family protein [Euryarchaeota archaeon]
MTKGKYKIVLLGGDGTGPEVVAEGRRAMDAAAKRLNLNLEYEEFPCGGEYYLKTGKEWPDGSFDACKAADAILLGAVGWPGASLPSGDIAGAGIVFGLRFGLDLYANVRPTKLFPGVRHKIGEKFKQVWEPKDVDFVVIRENSEGEYTPARGHLTRGGKTELTTDTSIITRKGAERVIKYAFELSKTRNGAPKDGLRRVTCIDKSNVLRGSQFFREIFDEIAAGYQGIERDYAYIDAFCQWIIRNPEAYDVAVTTNMFGDIATDLASVLQGGMGMAAGGNIGDDHAMFEPIHGSSPKHAGKGIVNPMATILASSMMLEWLGKRHNDAKMVQGARLLEQAVAAVAAEGKTLTYDLGGSAKTGEVGGAVVQQVKTLPL